MSILFGESQSGRRLAFHESNEIQKKELEWTPGVDGADPTIKLRLVGSPRAIGKIVQEDLLVFVLGTDMPSDADIANLPVRVSGLPVGVRQAEEIELVVRVGD